MSELQSTFAAILIRAHKERDIGQQRARLLPGGRRRLRFQVSSKFAQIASSASALRVAICPAVGLWLPWQHGCWQLQALPPFVLDPMLTERSELQSK
jgi:hypothetical protein